MIDAPHSTLLCEITRHALNHPDKVALVEGTDIVTYAQLLDRVGQTAGFMQSNGLKPGDRIVLVAQKELSFVYYYLAAHLVGVVNVVVDAASPRDRIDYIIDIVKPAALFGNTAIHIDGLYCDELKTPASGETEVLDLPQLSADDLADVMFTTGTTGAPKGVCLTHANIAGSAGNTNGFIGTSADDIEALALPLSHSFGLGRLRCVLMAGATLVLVGNFANLKSFFTVLDTWHVTGFGMVPAVWQYIKRLSGRRIARFADQIRYIEIGSAALPVEDKRLLLEIFPDTRLCMHYGLTEASRAMFSEFHTDVDNLETIGRPASSLVEACVLDDAGNSVADGEDGEICVRGNMVTRSYFNPADNDASFYGNWFRTGDWGHRDCNGNYYLTGRKKELINVGGEKVSPVTIEDAILSLGIADCACIAVPDPNGVLGEVPKAYLVQQGETISIEDIKSKLSSLLPPHEIPVLWEWTDHIPRTASGKIQRLKLKQ
jgi:long-chain acyl-CoA synthetase